MDNPTALIVNGEEIGLRDLLHGYKVRHGAQFLDEAIQVALVRQAAGDPADIPAEELQAAADDYRRQCGLYEADATLDWLNRNGLTVEEFEERVVAMAQARRLRDRIAEGQVEAFFAGNRAAFDQATVSRLVVADREVAAELLTQIDEEGAEFGALAREYSTDERTRPAGGYYGTVDRRSLGSDAEAMVFGGSSGAVVGPVKTEGGWMLLRVEALQNAELNHEVREKIKDLLFAQWLQEQRSKAKVETPLLDQV